MRREELVNPPHPEDDEPVCDTDYPYPISEETYYDSPLEHKFMTYWAVNDVLTDENEQIVDISIIDQNNLGYFNKGRYGETLYVCNENLGFVAHIDKTYENYEEAVMKMAHD